MNPSTEGWKLRAAFSLPFLVALALTLFAACGGSAGAPSSPTLSEATVIRVPGDPTATPQPDLGPAAYRFLYSEFGRLEDTVWNIDPGDVANPVAVTKLPHAEGWATTPVLSPGGGTIAYNAMPEGAMNPAFDAETRLLHVRSGRTRVVARQVDLLTRPLWSPDGQLLFVRRNIGEDVAVIVVDLRPPEEEPEPGAEEEPPPARFILRRHISDAVSYTPLGFRPGEEPIMFFVQVQGGTQGGTIIGRYQPATGVAVATATAFAGATATVVQATATAAFGTPTPTPVPASPVPPTPTPTPTLTGSDLYFISEQNADDVTLSPDGTRVAFLVPGLVGGQFVYRTHVFHLDPKTGEPLPVPPGVSEGDQLSPVWYPDGEKVTVGQLPSGPDTGGAAIIPLDGSPATLLPPPPTGFDDPISWSPDGAYLAVSYFPGESLGNPGNPRLVFVTPLGQRPAAPQGAAFVPIGWIPQ